MAKQDNMNSGKRAGGVRHIFAVIGKIVGTILLTAFLTALIFACLFAVYVKNDLSEQAQWASDSFSMDALISRISAFVAYLSDNVSRLSRSSCTAASFLSFLSMVRFRKYPITPRTAVITVVIMKRIISCVNCKRPPSIKKCVILFVPA